MQWGGGFFGKTAIGTRRGIWQLAIERNLAVPNTLGQPTTTALIARSHHITGNIGIHELGWSGGVLWGVNTLFSCLCTFDARHNFVPRWKPDFNSRLLPEDRCHLNGMAMGTDGPRYASALAQSDEAEGWRKHKVDGGCFD